MKSIPVILDDETVQKLAARAQEAGLDLDTFLSKAVQNNADKLLRPRKWMNRERWDALARGEGCPDCAHLQSGQNPHGFIIAELAISRLDLMKSQFVPGACVLYCRRHVTEPFELTHEERQAFFADLLRSSEALARVFQPLKMNYQILGNSGPHLHAYLQPRFYGDLEPGWPIDPFQEQVLLSETEYQERVQAIRQALDQRS